MAFTITRQPSKFAPVYNELTYNVLSSNYTQPEMKYIFKVYVEGTLVNTTKLYPLPTYNCLFDISTILKQYIIVPWIEPTSTNLGQTKENIKYYVEFYEEYIIDGVLTTSALLTTSTTNYAFPMSADRYQSNYMNNFVPISSNANPFAANRVKCCGVKRIPTTSWVKSKKYNPGETPRSFLKDFETYPITDNDIRSLTFIHRNSDFNVYPNKMIVRCYCKNNQVLTHGEDVNYSAIALYEKTLSVIPANTGSIYNLGHLTCSPSYLNAMSWNAIFPLLPTTISSTTMWGYSVELVYSTGFGTAVTNVYTHYPVIFRFIDDCFKRTHYTIKYRSKDWGWGYIDFNMDSQEIINTEKMISHRYRSYTDATYTSDRPVWGLNSRGKWVLNTDWIRSNWEIEEIIDMLGSPEVYIITEGDTGLYDRFIPVNIVTSEYEVKKLREAKLIQYTVEFEEAFDKNTRM